MEPNEYLLLPDQRQMIHDLIVEMHKTGLSPPEECVLNHLEAQENCAVDSRSD